MPVWLLPIFYLAFVLGTVLLSFYGERKLAAFFQDRLGPMEAGRYGLLQAAADILKLMQKAPSKVLGADGLLFAAAPVLVLLAVFSGFAAVPLWPGADTGLLPLGVFFILAVIALEVLGIWIAGYASASKFSMLGAMRALGQMVSYEVPLGLSALAIVVWVGSADLTEIHLSQVYLGEPIWFMGVKNGWDVGPLEGIFTWHIFQGVWAFPLLLVFYISALAECNRAPFDLPEGESEIIGGFHTEYSGFQFAIFFLAEYAMMTLVSLLAAFLFLGGWQSPLPNIGPVALSEWTSTGLWGFGWLALKVWMLIFTQIWLRWTLPRLRMDQLMALGWKVLTPIALVCLLLVMVNRYWLNIG